MLAFHRLATRLCPDRVASPLQGEAGALGLGELRLKDENGRFGLPAFKISGASWALERLLARRPGLRAVWAASEGNHGRAVARARSSAVWQRASSCPRHEPGARGCDRA